MDLTERTPGTGSRHPWELARARFIERTITRHLDGRPAGRAGRRWLDLGAGDGWLAGRIAATVGPGWSIDAVDSNYGTDDLDLARDAAPEAVSFHTEIPDGPYDAVSAFDVIEHIDDDRAVLATIVSRLAPGGIVFVTVPAYQQLFTAHDSYLQHHRRYSPAQLNAVLEQAGLRLVELGGLFGSLLPVRWLQAVVERRRSTPPEVHGIGAWERGPVLTRAITAVLDTDARAGAFAARHGVTMPGLSCYAVAVRSAT